MEMTYHVTISIELRISLYGTNSEMCNKLKFVDTMCECYYGTYV